MREQGDRSGQVTGRLPLGTYSPLPHPGLRLAGAGSGELLSAPKEEDSSNDSALLVWLWREHRKSSRHPCNLCPLADHGLARSHPPSHYGGSCQSTRASRVFMERQPDLASHGPGNHSQAAELPVSAEAGSALSQQARRGRLRNRGPGRSSGPSPALTPSAESGMLALTPRCDGGALH